MCHIGRSIQVPSWNKGSRLVPGKDVEIHLSKETRRLTDWVYDNPNVIPFDRVHQYTLDWKNTSITWSVDGKEIIDIRRLPGGKFVDDALPVSSRATFPCNISIVADIQRRVLPAGVGPLVRGALGRRCRLEEEPNAFDADDHDDRRRLHGRQEVGRYGAANQAIHRFDLLLHKCSMDTLAFMRSGCSRAASFHLRAHFSVPSFSCFGLEHTQLARP